MENNPQEFSLESFLRGTIKFYLSLWNLIKNGVITYWKHWLVLLLLFGLAFFFKARKIETYYDASSSYVKNFLPNKVYGDKLLDIQTLVSNKDYNGVSNTLNISKSAANTILNLEAKNIKGTPLHEDLTEMNVPFYIYASVRNKDSLPMIQDAVTQFLCEDKFVKDYLIKSKKKLHNELLLVSQEIKVLDSIKLTASQNEPNEIEKYFNLAKEREKEKIQLETKIKTEEAVTLLKPFVSVEVSKTSKLKSLGIKYLLIFLFSSLFLTTFLYWYNNPSDEY